MTARVSQQPFAAPDLHIPGYTGYVQGLQEVFMKTPVMAQLETKAPPETSFLHTRTARPPVAAPHRDPCNFPEEIKRKFNTENLWPCLQTRAVQDSFKPPSSNIALGDGRINPFVTSYSTDFSAPFPGHERLRSPMRNHDLAASQAALLGHYAAAYNRVGEKRLAKMISTMRERMSAKMGNNNDNAFKMRKLFKMYDRDGSGLIHYEDFRQFGESFGMQLDDDSLLALYHVHDPDGTGYVAYEPIVQLIMDPDYFCMYSPERIDNTQALADATSTARLVAHLRARVRGGVDGMRAVFEGLDADGSGVLPARQFEAGCAALGVVLSAREREWAERAAGARDGSGATDYRAFCDALAGDE
ncbi:flagellar associated protein [Raphidocelis subcapitata]|uniref:Flagellar associated protein n=1 Tax=Raphidocelis subcapitata TaxID=307507 RepID=A0A2V0NRN1_9CHLO|nr:flagellar associated protein [Raphidocelis subcapitata]|eukprot:GBF88223.1 flagellar associated protein [Raphidocelis subcapitata]